MIGRSVTRLKWRPYVLGVVVGATLGVAATRISRSDRGSETRQRAHLLLATYGKNVGRLAEAVSAFIAADLRDREKVMAAASPLGNAIQEFNDAYIALETVRLELLQAAVVGQSAQADDLACRLMATDEFQWGVVRSRLNSLVLNIIVVYRHGASEETLHEMRRQQEDGWRQLCGIFAEGAVRFTSDAPVVDCAPEKTASATPK